MHLIILSAFGKMWSEPMVWPNVPFYIEFPVLNRHMDLGFDMAENVPGNADPLKIKKARFDFTGKYQVLLNGRTAAIYELVDLS